MGLHITSDLTEAAVSAQSLARFSDNYFDVPAGRTVRVTCSLPEGWRVEQARASLQVRSLYDSFSSP